MTDANFFNSMTRLNLKSKLIKCHYDIISNSFEIRWFNPRATKKKKK